jgi:WD40 repeat protein
LRVWNGATGTALLTLDTHECVHNLAFMHDGECLIAAAGTIRLWDAEK